MSLIRTIRGSDRQTLDQWLSHLAARSVALDAELIKVVTLIVDDVRTRGDQALIDYTARFDNVQMKSPELRIGEEELRRVAASVDERVLEALRLAIKMFANFTNVRLKSRGPSNQRLAFDWGKGSRHCNELVCTCPAGRRLIRRQW